VVDAFYSKHKAHLGWGLAIAVGLALAAFAGMALYADRTSTSATQSSAPSAAQSRQRPNFVRLPSRHFGDWSLSCIQLLQSGGTECALTFNAVDKSQKHLLLRMSVAKTAKGPVMIVLTPPAAGPSAGFSFTPDKGAAIAIPYVRCLPGYCETAFALTEPIVTSLKTAQSAQVKFLAGKQPVSFRMPMAGFADGYAAWLARTAPPPAGAKGQSRPR
jgi:invasion protein IalB